MPVSPPTGRGGAVEHGVANLLRPQGGADGGLEGRPALQAGEEVGQGVDERVLVADGAAGHPPVLHVGVLEIGDVDPLPAGEVVLDLLAGRRIDVAEILQHVRVFQVEEDRAVFAVELEGVVVLPPAGVAGALERAQGAVGEDGQEHAGVVDGDRLDLAGLGVLALLDERSVWATTRLDRPVEPFGRVDGVGQQVAGHAGAGHVGVQPPEGHAALRHVGRDGVVLVIGGAVVEGASDAPFVDDLLGQRDGRHAAIVEGDHVGHAGPLHGRHHLLGLGGVHRQRLLADHHLAGRGGGHHDVVVQHVGHANVDQVDVLPGDQLPPVGLLRLVAPGGGEFFQLVLLFRPGAAGLQHRLMLRWKRSD